MGSAFVSWHVKVWCLHTNFDTLPLPPVLFTFLPPRPFFLLLPPFADEHTIKLGIHLPVDACRAHRPYCRVWSLPIKSCTSIPIVTRSFTPTSFTSTKPKTCKKWSSRDKLSSRWSSWSSSSNWPPRLNLVRCRPTVKRMWIIARTPQHMKT